MRHSVHAVISCRLSVVTQDSRRWLRSISGVLTPTFSTQPPPVLDPFVDDAGALLGYAGSGARPMNLNEKRGKAIGEIERFSLANETTPLVIAFAEGDSYVCHCDTGEWGGQR